jgi:tetratricopeptide (TPR) repeat protein
MEAYEHYLRGRHALVRFTTEEYFRSIEHFDRAIARDPAFALAYVGLAVALTELTDNGRMDRGQVGARGLAAAARAVAIDPELGDAHCAQAYARMVFEFDWEGAEQGFKRALELSPGNAEAYDLYGRLCAGQARFDEALALHERAYELDPFTCLADLATSQLRAGRAEAAERQAVAGLRREPRSARLHATLGWAIFRQGRIEEGLAKLEEAVSLAPLESSWIAQRGQALALAGRTEEARALLGQLTDPARPVPASPYHLAYLHTGLGDADRAIDCLERAFTEGNGPLYGMKGSFLLTPLREHPRFIALLKKMRLA